MEEVFELFIPILFIVGLFGTIALSGYLKYRTRRERQLTIRSALEKGDGASTELMEQLICMEQPQIPRPARDLRVGCILVAIGAALLVPGILQVDGNSLGGSWSSAATFGLGAIPLMIGIAYLVLWHLGRRAELADREQEQPG